MAKKYQVGDIVECRYPYQDDPLQWTKRPGLILKIEMKGTTPFFVTAKITTSVKNADKFIGKVVTVKSVAGRSMRLTADSFIHLENIALLPLNAILRYTGHCPIVAEIHEICKNKGIKI
jgi:hypothetical protein